MSLADAVAHLSPERWEKANRLLIRKALAEFAHERLITPNWHSRTVTCTSSAVTTV